MAGRVFLATLLCVPPSLVHALDYPNKVIRLVVPFPPGGGVDLAGRFVAQALSDAFGQAAVVDNRPGAGSNLGTDIVAKSAADGYTLLVNHNAIAINPMLYDKLPYDAVRDFTQVALLGATTNTLVIGPGVPARSVRELISHLKTRPGTVNYASTGIGGTAHLAMAYFMLETGTQLLHVPYKGIPSAMVDLIGGEVQVMMSSLAGSLPFIKAKRINALATSGAKRSSFLPDLPTLSEAGVPGYEFELWYGLHVPAKTPKAIVVKLNEVMVRTLSTSTARQQLANEGIEASLSGTPDAFSRFVRAEMVKMGRIIKATGARPE